MPRHENLDALQNTEAKEGLEGAVGGHLETSHDVDGQVGTLPYDAQLALGDDFDEDWNTPVPPPP